MKPYVTDLRASFGSLCCYMLADDETALSMGFQLNKSGQYRLNAKQRAQVIRMGGLQVTDRQLGAIGYIARCGEEIGDPRTAIERMHALKGQRRAA